MRDGELVSGLVKANVWEHVVRNGSNNVAGNVGPYVVHDVWSDIVDAGQLNVIGYVSGELNGLDE